MNAVDANNNVISFGKDSAVIGPGIPEPHPFLGFSQQISNTFDQGFGDRYFCLSNFSLP